MNPEEKARKTAAETRPVVGWAAVPFASTVSDTGKRRALAWAAEAPLWYHWTRERNFRQVPFQSRRRDTTSPRWVRTRVDRAAREPREQTPGAARHPAQSCGTRGGEALRPSSYEAPHPRPAQARDSALGGETKNW